MREIFILYNSKGINSIQLEGNASDKRVLQILKRSVKMFEKRISDKGQPSTGAERREWAS